MTLLVVIWSAGYIPQVYSLILFLTALTQSTPVLQLPFLVSGVFGHGGVATWTILTTFALWVVARERWAGRLLFYLVTIFTAYVAYTTVIYALVGGYRSVIEAVFAFLRGEKILINVAPVATTPPTASLGNLALSVLGIMGLLIFLHGKEALKVLAFISASFLVS